MRALVLVAAAGCWTGGDSGQMPDSTSALTMREPATKGHDGFKLKLERTHCMGACPVYSVVLHGDGRVEWDGRANVLARGARRGRCTEREISELERLLGDLKFFERDEYGHLPLKPECTTTNNTTSCTMGGSFSFCSDTSHTIISVTRKYKTHTIDNANCSDDDELARLETMVDRIANVQAWVGDE